MQLLLLTAIINPAGRSVQFNSFGNVLFGQINQDEITYVCDELMMKWNIQKMRLIFWEM